MPSNTDDKIEVHERLAKIEAVLEAIREALDDQKDCDESLSKKIDKILENDKDKLERIVKTEEKVKNVARAMYAFIIPIVISLARWFV